MVKVNLKEGAEVFLDNAGASVLDFSGRPIPARVETAPPFSARSTGPRHTGGKMGKCIL